MAYEDKTPDTLSDIALYAGYAEDSIRHTQEHLRKMAAFLGADGEFLRAAADQIGDAIHDELTPNKLLALAALDSGVPQKVAAWGDRGDAQRAAE
jgi:hypothetical protein